MSRNSNDKNELFLKNLALEYTKKSGIELQKELAGLQYQGADISAFDERVKSRVKADKIKKWTSRLMPVAACIAIFMVYIALGNIVSMPNLQSDSFVKNEPSKMLTYEFIDTKLPQGYILEKVDYDHQKAIYYIETGKNNKIVLVVEEFTDNIDTEGLERLNINDQNAYGIAKEDYSLIQYEKDNLLYTLTTPGGYTELIKLSENLI